MINKPYKTLPNNEYFDLLDPDLKLINIEYIAKVLSRINRFGGDTQYSVAQHSYNCYKYIQYSYPGAYGAQLLGLVHDAPEAYIGDIITPQKHLLYFKIGNKLLSFSKLDKRLSKKIGQALNIRGMGEDNTTVKNADIIIGRKECSVLLPNRTTENWDNIATMTNRIPDQCDFNIWSSEKAEVIFLRTYNKLKRLINGSNP